MDPRSPLSAAGGPRGVKRRVPSPSENAQQLHTVNPAQTSLPSISQLVNAFSAPTSATVGGAPHASVSSPEVAYYAHGSQPITSYVHERDIGTFGYGPRGESGAGSTGGGGGDSEHEEVGIIDGPPKKKRRRQALSCTGKSYLAILTHSLFPPYTILLKSFQFARPPLRQLFISLAPKKLCTCSLIGVKFFHPLATTHPQSPWTKFIRSCLIETAVFHVSTAVSTLA